MTNVEQLLHTETRRGKTPGLQYVHVGADDVLYQYADGVARVSGSVPVTRATTFNGFSVTKTVTAVAILQLVDRGLLQLDQPARTFHPAFPYPNSITVRHLLTHSAGIANPIPLRWIHLAHEHNAFNRRAFFANVYKAHEKLVTPPGTKFAYTNLGYQLLGEIVEHVAGISYEQYVTDNILHPIGAPANELGFVMDSTLHARGYHRRMSVSYPILGFLLDASRSFECREGAWQMFRAYHMNGAAYGGLVGSADGFARFVHTLIGEKCVLLSEESRAQMFSEYLLSGGRRSGMSMSWFTGSLSGERYLHHAGGGGGYYAELRIYPRLRRASVVLFNRTGMTDVRFLDKVDSLLLG